MYWLKLEKDTFVWVNNDSVLLYNAESGQHFLCGIDSPETESIVHTLADPYKLGCLKIDESQLGKNGNIIEWIIKLKLGQIIQSDIPPVSYPPVLNLQCDSFRMVDDNIRDDLYQNTYLKEIVIYLTGSLSANAIAKQVIYPLEGDSFMPLSSIITFLDDCLKIGINSLSVCITPGHHPNEAQFLEAIRRYPISKRLFVKASSLKSNDLSKYKLFDEITVIFHHDNDLLDIFNDTPAGIKKRILIENDSDYTLYNKLIEKDPTVSAVPLYTGHNEQFFYDNVLLSHSEILRQSLNKRIIYAHQRANINRFGILSIVPNGNVYSNLAEAPIGTIKDSIQSIVAAEMKSNKGWLNVRNEYPCSNCLCRYLCPSPTSYEKMMNHVACCEGTEITVKECLI